jgi:hypothetical protein
MVRKQTWILLIIFAALLGATFYLQKNPLPASADLTPSPTSSPKVLQGWESSDITWMELKESQGSTIQMVQDAQGNWTLDAEGKEKVETGKAEQLRAEIAEMRAIATLPGDYQLDALGLKVPARTLSIRDKQGKQITVSIGNTDPTESGYYVQVAAQPPVVVDRYTVDGIVDLFNSALPTPTPELESPTTPVNPLQPTATLSP